MWPAQRGVRRSSGHVAGTTRGETLHDVISGDHRRGRLTWPEKSEMVAMPGPTRGVPEDHARKPELNMNLESIVLLLLPTLGFR